MPSVPCCNRDLPLGSRRLYTLHWHCTALVDIRPQIILIQHTTTTPNTVDLTQVMAIEITKFDEFIGLYNYFYNFSNCCITPIICKFLSLFMMDLFLRRVIRPLALCIHPTPHLPQFAVDVYRILFQFTLTFSWLLPIFTTAVFISHLQIFFCAQNWPQNKYKFNYFIINQLTQLSYIYICITGLTLVW